eukprot:CAMPEP_0117495732 /NCGR_PEP_ID=MMETSP0784-20121206/20286_1 /TAXON_ID=39447 /ORGANISM="" /LENGTH=129 /DNA_ID=CAMNT_0005290667 /DNA_START=310 /DNA_END=696 /DNA_ORIENTATION=-
MDPDVLRSVPPTAKLQAVKVFDLRGPHLRATESLPSRAIAIDVQQGVFSRVGRAGCGSGGAVGIAPGPGEACGAGGSRRLPWDIHSDAADAEPERHPTIPAWAHPSPAPARRLAGAKWASRNPTRAGLE